MSKASNFFNTIGFYLTGGSNKGTTTCNNIILGLLVVVPVFLVMIAPYFAWLGLSPTNQASDKFYWLQSLALIWPLSLFGVLAVALIAWVIYNAVKNPSN